VINVERRYSREINRTIREIALQEGIEAQQAQLIAISLIAMIDGFWLQFMIDPQTSTRNRAISSCLGFLHLMFPALCDVWNSEAKSIARRRIHKAA
jgi:hypothetical protein